MTQPTATSSPSLGSPTPGFLPPRGFAGFAIAAVAVILIAVLSYQSLQARSESAALVRHSGDMLAAIEATFSGLKDMETGQRGYLITGEDRYLDPYRRGTAELPSQMARLEALAAASTEQSARVTTLRRLAAEKRTELAQTIEMRRLGQVDEARRLVLTDRGRATMQQIRALVAEMTGAERSEMQRRQEIWQRAANVSFLIQLGGAGVLLLLIIIAAVFASRDYREREIQAWLRAGQMRLAERLQGDQRLESMGETALDFLSEYLSAPLGVVYIVEGERLRSVASHGRDEGGAMPATAIGLIGQAVRGEHALHFRDVPDDYFQVSSGLGRGKTNELALVPARADGMTHAVIELGFFRRLRPWDLAFFERVSETLGVALRSAKDRSHLEDLLEETQRQSEELQTQQEELRVSNEELEEQSRLTRQSQALLEAQHTELEQTNAQLEEQAQMLEAQKLDLTDAQAALEARAEDLERANRHKSEFLANMSHELRTPLNSTLILSRLLADNRQGNLTDEEVKFAETISSAGNDLLVLINDILDLSKIESGKLELFTEPTEVAPLLDEIVSAFRPMAEDKGLAFRMTVADDAPASLDTDRQRLAQILKNLVSNALKFTEKGSVELRVQQLAPGTLSFVVADTGIGLPAHQHEIIFEAFRQADGSTHRRYGGTGLGLSISRDLARRLGGDITLRSEAGQGSTFTLTLPLAYEAATAAPAPASWPRERFEMPARQATSPKPAAPQVPDDHEALEPGRRVILAIEDDPAFATILRDLVREMGFQCVLAHTAGEGLDAAARHVPHAILLDMNLPDLSGLGVLDQLKRNPRTRHIPVHVISASDYSREAMELGAVGYALKPVKREELESALRRLESKFTQGERRVLVVEDDARQRDSMRALLETGETRVVAVENATEALAQLAASTFDCMVMDLNLPDLSGYQLLERMSEHEDLAFPPVIVYTGRSLSREEELRLRKFSDSIILKGARSPERLLDEVTLFLHQVESSLPPESQRMLKAVRERDEVLEDRSILVVEDDVRNIFALTSVLQPKGARIEVARNGREALECMARRSAAGQLFDLVLMDIMMPEMDGLTAMREIRKRPEWAKVPIIALTAKAMKDDQEQCIAAGANDYMAKPLDVDRLLSLARVWIAK